MAGMLKQGLGVVLLVLGAPALAQVKQPTPNYGGFGSPGSYREDAASALGRYLRMVTADPRNLEALTGAGRAALEVGDAQAAIGFYARAEAIAPRNGRVKAGLGSALVLLNQEQAALRYFSDAVELGVPEADIASDRGLAYDLRGSSKRAQRDYAVALQRGADPETTRRLALSLAIGGERDAALALLDPLLRRQDAAALRARAFILAMTGDAAGASRAAGSVMTPAMAAGFVPFFRKLPSLRPGEKAAAVHFGNFPGEGRPMRIDDLFNQAEVAARVALENSPRSTTDAGLVDTTQSALGRSPNIVGGGGRLVATAPPSPLGIRVATATPRPDIRSSRTPSSLSVPANDIRVAAPLPGLGRVNTPVLQAPPAGTLRPTPSAVPAPSSSTPSNAANLAVPGLNVAGPPPSTRITDISATVREIAREPLVRPVDIPQSSLPSGSNLPSVDPQPRTEIASPNPASSTSVPPSGTLAAAPVPLLPSEQPAVASASPAPAPARVERLADIAAMLSSPSATETASAPAVAIPPTSGPKIELPAAATSNGIAEDAGDGSRVWVQVAGGADARAFSDEWRRLKAKAPDLLDTRTAWTTPIKATNRLLVGPFENRQDAQGFVNKLALKGITAFAWSSAKGQEIAKLATR